MTATPPSWLPTGDWLRALFAPALVFIATSVDRNYNTDFWHHLARGRAIVERGGLVNEDLFTFTVAGKPFQDANWLTQVAYYFQFTAGGLPLVQFLNSLTLALMIGVVVWHSRRASGSLVCAAAIGALTVIGLWQLLIIRPQTYSLLLFVGLHTVLERAWERRIWLLAAPWFLALWVNLHGGFPIGLVLVGSYAAAACWEAWLAHRIGLWRDSGVQAFAGCLAACAAATLLNPYGWKVYEYVGVTSTVANARHIDEWLPPGLNLLVGKIWVASLLGLLVLLTLAGERLRTREVFLILCFLPLACGSVRMVAWWLLVSAPMATRLVNDRWRRRQTTPPTVEAPSWAAAASVGLLGAVALACLPWLERYNPVLGLTGRTTRTEDHLEQATARLGNAGGGRIFSRFEWGEYLSWSLHPRYTIFMDGRIEIFPDEVWEEFSAITRGRADWEAVLDRYDVDYLLLDEAGFHHDLLPQVRRSRGWQQVAASGTAVLFQRQPSSVAQAEKLSTNHRR